MINSNPGIPSFCIERNSIVKTKMMIRLWQIASDRPTRLLDVGCGDGEWLVEFLRNVPNIDYSGIEPGRRQVDQARQNLSRFVEQIHQGRGEDIPRFFEGSFDVVISRAVFEHVRNREGFLNGACNALAPGGGLLFTYGSNHFKKGLQTGIRNLVSQGLAQLGYDRYYAAPVDEPKLVASLQSHGLQLLERRHYSFDQVKNAHKLISQPDESREVLLEWLALEDRLNELATDPQTMLQLTNEAYFEARKEG